MSAAPWRGRRPDGHGDQEVLSGAERALLEDYRQLGAAGRGLVRAVIDHLRQSHPSKE